MDSRVNIVICRLIPGACVPPHEVRQLLSLSAFRNVQGLFEWVQEKGNFQINHVQVFVTLICYININNTVKRGTGARVTCSAFKENINLHKTFACTPRPQTGLRLLQAREHAPISLSLQ